MKLILPAAGRGSRVRHLTLGHPKALVALKPDGRCALDYLVEEYSAIDTRHDILIVIRESEKILFQKWLAGYPNDLQKMVRFIYQPDHGRFAELGAGGALSVALDASGQDTDVCIIGCDLLFPSETLAQMYTTFHMTKSPTAAYLSPVDKKMGSTMGIITLDESGRITSFAEKPEHPESPHASTMLYMLPSSFISKTSHLIDSWPYRTEMHAGDILKELIDGNHPVYGHKITGVIDLGNPDILKEVLAHK